MTPYGRFRCQRKYVHTVVVGRRWAVSLFSAGPMEQHEETSPSLPLPVDPVRRYGVVTKGDRPIPRPKGSPGSSRVPESGVCMGNEGRETVETDRTEVFR